MLFSGLIPPVHGTDGLTRSVCRVVLLAQGTCKVHAKLKGLGLFAESPHLGRQTWGILFLLQLFPDLSVANNAGGVALFFLGPQEEMKAYGVCPA